MSFPSRELCIDPCFMFHRMSHSTVRICLMQKKEEEDGRRRRRKKEEENQEGSRLVHQNVGRSYEQT